MQHDDHSSRSRIASGLKQPTRGSQQSLLRVSCIRAGPALPSYLALLHAGFSVPRVSPPGRWALTPPFHHCQMRSTERGEPAVLPWACRRVRITPAVYFLWHFPWPRLRVSPSRNARRNPLALPGALPLTRQLLRAAGSGPTLLRAEDHGSPDFPPVCIPCEKQTGDHPTHPLIGL